MYGCGTLMVTYGQKSEDVNNEHDILKHRHSSSAVDVTKVYDERNRPYLVLSVISNLITVIKIERTISVPCQLVASYDSLFT